ncbi:MAG: helix-turn-helix domain-containing protein [Verrucomicrobia bacterium]|jgi:excisionase family DNA binding protein|nr:helix-turn-helix domain-containing protein [Verrucomicrobiota bacterium]
MRAALPSNGHHDGYMRRKEAAEYLAISQRTLTNLMARRVIPYYKPSSRITLFSKSELDAALQRSRSRAVGEDLSRR